MKMASSMRSDNHLNSNLNSIQKTVVENKKSQLLNDDENEIIFTLLGRKCSSLSTAVAQLLLTKSPDHIKWHVKCTGVVCFVKDNPKRSYFIRVYDFDQKMLIWEQELYTTFEYKNLRPIFHSFEAHNCMAGLYFANAQEAQHFNETVQGKLENRRKKPQSKKTNHAPINIQPNDQGITIQMPSKNHLLKNVSKLSTNGSNKTKRKMLSKKDIGTPTNFQHVQHIGWNSETQSFEADKIIDKKLLSYLESQFGFTQEQLNDAGTVNFIHKFLNEHGGMDKAVKELDAPIPVPPAPPIISKIINNGYPNHTTNNQSNGVLFPPPPPVPPSMHTTSYVSPSHQSRKQIMAPSIPAAHPPPPPPLPQSLPLATSTVNVPKSIVETAPPPPPPPPPPPSFSNFSSTISSNNESVSKNNVPSQTSNNRSAFLEEIRKGAILHHVEPSEMCSNQSNNNQNQTGDVRGQLLDQIRKGVDLRKVEINANKPQTKPSSKIGGSGLADALARALQERSRALNQTDDSSNDDSNTSDDDEWDDRSS